MSGDFERFSGMRRLVAITADGRESPGRGARPTGLITYHQSGWMAAQIQPDRPPVGRAGDRPSAEEALAAIHGYTAYFGTFAIDEAARTITHRRKGSVMPGWERQTEFGRRYEFVGADRVILRPLGNLNELVWERL